jgi:glycosyltransferase involved in cell wall biosynthesis
MACATPVIGADVGGIRHTVRDGETGFLVPPRDPDALAARLEVLRADPARAKAMGEAGRARANAYFTWRGIARELEDVYLQVAPARADRSRVAASAGAAPSRAALRAFG